MLLTLKVWIILDVGSILGKNLEYRTCIHAIKVAYLKVTKVVEFCHKGGKVKVTEATKFQVL